MSDREADHGLVQQVLRVTARAQAPLELLERVAAVVRARIPYEAAGWILVDPDSLLLTDVHAENVTREQHLALIECELAEDDVTKFADLAGADVPAASLSSATAGDLSRSARYRRVYAPHGLGDEIRAVFRSGGTTWGNACLTRRTDQPWFTDHEVDMIARLCPHVGDGLSTCLSMTAAAVDSADGPRAGAALVVLTDDGSVESMTAEAEALLGPLDDDRLGTTIAVHEVAQRARLLAEDGLPGPPAHARARTRDGGWVVVRGARLERASGGRGRSAVVLEPARPSDIAPLVLRLRRLTAREREVTELLLSGRSTRDIAEELWITTETLRGHVKSIFAKLHVGSRPELAATLLGEPATDHRRGGDG